MKVLETDRLILRWLSTDDAAFMLELLNDPLWLRYIGDRGVHTLADARTYIADGPVTMYHRLGFGLYLTELKAGNCPIGICGLIKRDFLADVDIGFAFLPQFRAQGYAFEAASAVLGYARHVLGLQRIAAITALDNHASGRLLAKLGFAFEQIIPFPADGEEIKLYGVEWGDRQG